jgi:hypothetical protein
MHGWLVQIVYGILNADQLNSQTAIEAAVRYADGLAGLAKRSRLLMKSR